MHFPNDNSSSLTCEALFELSRASEFGLAPELTQFLLSVQLPWAALGKSLTRFIEDQVAKIPAEKRLLGRISPLAVIEGDQVVVEEGASIEPHVMISGPTYVCAGATIRQGAYVRGSVYLASGAVVGHTTEVKGSLLLSEAKAAHFAYVGDSILGCCTNLGAGTKLANMRFDHGIVSICSEGRRTPTGLKKLGAILGNRAQTGCNSVTNPGAILLPDAFIIPNSTGTGTIRPRLLERAARS